MSTANDIFPLYSSGVGYGLVIGFSSAFALVMCLISFLLKKYFQEVQDSEMYLTAKRSIKSGLIASSVVSSWTLSATLLTSTTFTYSYGISASFWYSAGCCCQIFLFAVAATELKRKAPNAHTFLEVVKFRYGAWGHLVLCFYSLVYQFFISINLLVGAAQIFENVTGMSQEATCFLFPLGVGIYTYFGGLKATFLTEWLHTSILFIIMLISLFVLYATGKVAGSPGFIFDLLKKASAEVPVDGNAGGEYLTLRSVMGGMVGLIFLGGGFSATVDSQLFQKAIAAHPRSTFVGYVLGALCWFTIPFCLSITYGLGARALELTPAWPTYPNALSAADVNNSMVMPYLAYAIMGKGGVILILIALFQAVTSALSSETVAVTSLLTYDIYRGYVKPNADDRTLRRVSHLSVLLFLLVIASVAVGFCHAGFSVSFIVTAIGILIDGAVIPSACTLFWKKQSKYAVAIVPVLSSMISISTWIAVAYHRSNSVTISTLSDLYPIVAGNMIALTAPIILTPLITFLGPEDFDFEKLKGLQTVNVNQSDDSTVSTEAEKGVDQEEVDSKATGEEVEESVSGPDQDHHKREVLRLLAIALFFVLSICILWPIPMYGTSYIFSKDFFTGWIVVTFIFAFLASGTIIVYPIFESRLEILLFFKAIGRGVGSSVKSS
ncbi:hypothetical protein CANTEDRAFT_128749 [Yamadazyma tenuis ATCC 10573]|uniref:Na+/solute symporter n=1 Tax=Candida tenuis (strain ATCC 10573 / BCRC 21748 / CBS 615 / JCM 9827 / NBRC 10315 / NRRL Y-1498 / VKM Y-70) TaxID=590646 RepID=G3BDF0_CANTC|nr:uncharacterized protein CANTEDRAFT_128749 [Yamadazyma tenuis ATCC 10573]EGV60941.1 hypothetical protein CANTEDRAFT_128749 [Yamadazyma tenuis ATCC 10573]